MRRLITDIIELAGLASITAGSAIVSAPAGWVVGGFAALFVGSTFGKRG